MIDVAIMLEGQNGLNWERWKRIARLVEDVGFVGLYRSDHFTNANPPDMDSLDAWISMTWLASHTERIEFGPLVSPVSFRDPVMLARAAQQIDDLSGGRLTLGIGAGWQEREHTMFGYDLLDLDRRFARFEESLHVVRGLLHSDAPVSFHGEFYQLREATLLPRPQRRVPLLIGGNGPKRTLPLAARFADEWNAVFAPTSVLAERNQQLDELLRQNNRQPGDLRRSLMTGLFYGVDDAAIQRKLGGRSADEVRARGGVVGPASAVVEQLGQIAETGMQRVMLQWLDLDDLDGLEALGRDVLPQLG